MCWDVAESLVQLCWQVQYSFCFIETTEFLFTSWNATSCPQQNMTKLLTNLALCHGQTAVGRCFSISNNILTQNMNTGKYEMLSNKLDTASIEVNKSLLKAAGSALRKWDRHLQTNRTKKKIKMKFKKRLFLLIWRNWNLEVFKWVELLISWRKSFLNVLRWQRKIMTWPL